MQLILKNGPIAKFIDRFNEQDHLQTLKDLILIGIDVVLTKLKQSLNNEDVRNVLNQRLQNHNKMNIIDKKYEDDPIIRKQIELIKRQIQKINQRFNESEIINKKKMNRISPPKYIVNQVDNQDALITNYQSKQRKKQSITPKITQIYPEVCLVKETKFLHRHHLDDAQLKQIFTYDNYIQQQEGKLKNKEKKQLKLSPQINYRNLQVKNKQLKVKIEQIKTQKSLELLKKKKSPELRRQNSGPKYLRNVQSKIKDVIITDKLKVKNTQLNNGLEIQKKFIKSKLFENSENISNQYSKVLQNKDQIYSNKRSQIDYDKLIHPRKKQFQNENINILNTQKFSHSSIQNNFQFNPSGISCPQSKSSQFSVFNQNNQFSSSVSKNSEINNIQIESNYETKKVCKAVGKISRKNERDINR